MGRERVVENEGTEDEVIEVEVERLPPSDEGAPPAPSPGRRVWRAVRPVLAGAFIDAVDFATLPSPAGFLIGFLAGAWLASQMRVTRSTGFLVALATAVYCVLPFTRLLPVATLLGVLGRIKLADSDDPVP